MCGWWCTCGLCCVGTGVSDVWCSCGGSDLAASGNWATDVIADPVRFDFGWGMEVGIATSTRLGTLEGLMAVGPAGMRIESLTARGGDIELTIRDGALRTADRWDELGLDLVVHAVVATEWLTANNLDAIVETLPLFIQACPDARNCTLHFSGSAGRPAVSSAL